MNALAFVLDPHDGADLLVDGASLRLYPGTDQFGWFSVDVAEVARAACGVGPAWPLTCECTVPGCAGLYGPADVRSNAGVVTWRFFDRLNAAFSFRADALRCTVRETLAAASARPPGGGADVRLIAEGEWRPWHEAVALALAVMDDPQPTPYAGD